jgi:hypothetical protein
MIRLNPFLKPVNLSLGFPPHSKRYPATKQGSQVPPDKPLVWMEAEKSTEPMEPATVPTPALPNPNGAPVQSPKPKLREALARSFREDASLGDFSMDPFKYLLPKPCPRKGAKKVALYFTLA